MSSPPLISTLASNGRAQASVALAFAANASSANMPSILRRNLEPVRNMTRSLANNRYVNQLRASLPVMKQNAGQELGANLENFLSLCNSLAASKELIEEWYQINLHNLASKPRLLATRSVRSLIQETQNLNHLVQDCFVGVKDLIHGTLASIPVWDSEKQVNLHEELGRKIVRYLQHINPVKNTSMRVLFARDARIMRTVSALSPAFDQPLRYLGNPNVLQNIFDRCDNEEPEAALDQR